ncbi:hypothetical protein [Bradyrhizobium centrolobii]|uniref:hypothetical protein n=1 Tax=Bradyrhizobium centrolobii TaxID=1505087 RepID=UPI000B16BB6A|nr:hypothetical protein [Bradyrhizobium centrolobii]
MRGGNVGTQLFFTRAREVWIYPRHVQNAPAVALATHLAALCVGKFIPRSPNGWLNGRNEGIHIHGSDWQQFARQVSLSPARAIKRVDELCKLVQDKADEAHDAIASSSAGASQILDQVVFAVKSGASGSAISFQKRIKRSQKKDPASTASQNACKIIERASPRKRTILLIIACLHRHRWHHDQPHFTV